MMVVGLHEIWLRVFSSCASGTQTNTSREEPSLAHNYSTIMAATRIKQTFKQEKKKHKLNHIPLPKLLVFHIMNDVKCRGVCLLIFLFRELFYLQITVWLSCNNSIIVRGREVHFWCHFFTQTSLGRTSRWQFLP